MPRKPRQRSAFDIYHIVVKGVNNQLLFEESNDYLKYLEILELQKEKCRFTLFAYCLMSNHVHLLLRTNQTPLDSIFRKINTTYATWFNMKYSRTGPLQDGRYYSEPVNSPEQLLMALRYIHKNPLKAHLEESIGSKYSWNSYYAYTKQNNPLVDTNFVLSEFASISDFIEYHSSDTNAVFIDIHNIKRRIPDDVAIEIIKKMFNTNHPTDISEFTLLNRRNAIFSLYENGISVRQINRLTGIPRGVIERILSNKI